MRVLCWVVLVFLNLAPSAHAQAVEPSQVVDCERRTFIPGRGDYPDTEKEPACLERLNGMAVRSGTPQSGKTLSLWLANGNIKHYSDQYHECPTDKSECDPSITFYLIGFRPKHQLYVVEKFYWDEAFTLLVSRQTGADMEIDAPPRFSPSGRQFITLRPDPYQYGHSCKVEVHEFGIREVDLPKITFQHNLPDIQGCWEFASWDGEDKAELTAALGAEQLRVDLVRTGNGWRLGKLVPVKR